MDSLGASTVRCDPSVSRLATFRASNGRRARTFTALTSAYVPKRDGYQQVVPLKVAHNDTTRWKTSESNSCTSPRRCRPGAVSHSIQQAGALGTAHQQWSPRPQSIPCSRLFLPAPPYAVAATGPALDASSEASGRGIGTRGGAPGTGLQEDKRQRRHRHDREEHGHPQRSEAEQLVDEQNRGGEDRHDDEGRQGPDHRPSRPARHHHLTRRTPHQET